MSEEKLQPKENPNQKPTPEADMQKAVETDHVHEADKDILADTADFVSASEKLNSVERKDVLEKAKEWELSGDLDLLRAAGLSLDQIKKSPLERHIKLAALFLHRDKSKPGLVFKLGYEGNEMAQWDLDLADILPSNVLKVDIYDQDGKLVFPDAERGFEDGRPGYFHGKPPKRIAVQEEYLVKIKQTQNGLAITDRRAGVKTYEHSLKEEVYMVDNARKTVLKQEIRKQAAAQGKEVKTDKSFFDNILTDLMKAFDPKIWENFQQNFKLDFSKIQTQLNGLLASLGMPIAAKALTDSSQPASSAQPEAVSSTYGDRISKIGKGSESLNSPRIDRDWLMQNVGDSPDKVERFMVRINFLGVNMRVNKLIAPYLAEAEARVRASGINVKLKQEQCSCLCWRPVRGGTQLSNHSWGVAVDLNSIDNPWQPNLNGARDGNKMICNWPPEFVSIMKDVGFGWGGEWNGRADPMHFEMKANPYQNRGVLRSSNAQSLAQQYLA